SALRAGREVRWKRGRGDCGPAGGIRALRPPPARATRLLGRAALGVKAEPLLETRAHGRPVVVDHRVPRGVAPPAAADEPVLAVDTFELGREGGERGTGPFVQRVRLE